MKAAQIKEYGGPSNVEIVEIEKPSAGEGQVLVEVYAASLNPFDTMVREGYVRQMVPALPVTLGGDIAGVVADVGPGVEGFAVGSKVYGQAAVVAGSSGAYAEYAAAQAGQVAQAPANLNFQQAAALPMVGASALQALTAHLDLQSGQKILITGGAGGVGSAAVQIAKHLGAYVAVTATGEGLATAKKLGADEVIDYETVEASARLHDYDVLFDTVGGDGFGKALRVLRRGGKAVSMIAQADESLIGELGVTALAQKTQVTTAVLDELRELVEAGVVLPQVGKVFNLDQTAQAFEAREGGQVIGKVIIAIR